MVHSLSRTQIGEILTGIVCISCCLLFTWMGQSFIAHNQLNDADNSYFLYGGKVIKDGGILYRDFWDQKPPGIFLQNALFLKFAKGDFEIYSWIHMFVIVLVCIALLFLLKPAPLFYRFLFLVLFCYGFNLNNYLDFGNRPEFLMSLLEIISFSMGFRYIYSGKKKYLFLMGFCCGLACWFKPVGMASGLAISAYLILNMKIQRIEKIISIFSVWSAFLASWAPFFIYGILHGVLYKAFSAMFLAPLSLSQSYVNTYGEALLKSFMALGPLWGLFLPIAVLFIFIRKNDLKKKEGKVLGYSFLFLLASLSGIVIQRGSQPHYFHQAVGPLCIFGVLSLSYTTQRLKLKKVKWIYVLLFFCLFIYLTKWSFVRQLKYVNLLEEKSARYNSYVKLGTWLKKRLKKGDAIYYWSHGYQPYLLSDTKALNLVSPMFYTMGKVGVNLVREDLEKIGNHQNLKYVIENEKVFPEKFNLGHVREKTGAKKLFNDYCYWRDSKFDRVEEDIDGFILYQKKQK